MEVRGFSVVSQRAQTEFAAKIAELLPPRYSDEEFGAAYAGAVIFLLAVITMRYPTPGPDKDILIRQIVAHLEMELKEKKGMSEEKFTFADMVEHAKRELRGTASTKRTIESIALELPHMLLADPDIVGPIRGTVERNKAFQTMMAECVNNKELKEAFFVVAATCLKLFPNQLRDPIFNEETVEDRRQGAEANGFANSER